MPCRWRTSDPQLLLTVTIFLVAECVSAEMESSFATNKSLTQQVYKQSVSSAFTTSSPVNKQQSNTTPPIEDKTSWTVHLNEKVVLSCPFPLTQMLLAMWGITMRNKSYCVTTYRTDRDEISKHNCTAERITWASRPDKNPALQIGPVDVTYEGKYTCCLAKPDGTFCHAYHLKVLVPPEVTLSLLEKRTAECRAVTRKPPAQISWTPEGDCVTEQVNQDNDTVTVQSRCHWAERSATTVSCSVSHWTGNKSESRNLDQEGNNSKDVAIILYSILFVPAFLFIVGSIWLLKNRGYSKCKMKKSEVETVEQDEMQPYASYTEKNNPLYDTAHRVKMS